ncbi:hypothetical protein BASA62_004618 [Batrachochytrium salamandrivorans]|nr:hypothetical protein BASA62_004618 [Batrachochytrium salamandrivorans]
MDDPPMQPRAHVGHRHTRQKTQEPMENNEAGRPIQKPGDSSKAGIMFQKYGATDGPGTMPHGLVKSGVFICIESLGTETTPDSDSCSSSLNSFDVCVAK